MKTTSLVLCTVVIGAFACETPTERGTIAFTTGAYDIDTDFIIKGQFQLRACGETSDRAITTGGGAFDLTWRNVAGGSPSATAAQDGASNRHTAVAPRRDSGNNLVNYESWANNVARANVHYCAKNATGCSNTIRRISRQITATAISVSEGNEVTSDFRDLELRPVRIDLSSPFDSASPGGQMIDSVLVTITGNQMTSRFSTGNSNINTNADPHAVNAFVRPLPQSGTIRTTSIGMLTFSQPGTYNIVIRVTFANLDGSGLPDGTSSPALQIADVITLPQVPPGVCDDTELRLTYPAARPSVSISGNLHFVPPAGDVQAGQGPRALAYHAEVRRLDDNTPIGILANGNQAPIQVAAGAETNPTYAGEPYSLVGVPPGRYSTQARPTTGGSGSPLVNYGTATLMWLPGNGFTYPASPFAGFPAMCRFPDLTDLMVGQGLYPDGSFYLSPGESRSLDRKASMAILNGVVNLEGCVGTPNISAGTAEIDGVGSGTNLQYFDDVTQVTRTYEPGNRGAFARGLFRIQTGSQPQSGNYEIAATRGDWREGKYRLKLDTDDYDGTLIVRPATPQAHQLNNGRGNPPAATRSFRTGKLGVTIRVLSPCSGAPDCQSDYLSFSQPIVTIGADYATAEQPYYLVQPADPNNPGSPTGFYSATSQGSNALETTHTVDIIGLVHSTATIQYRALVQYPNADWTAFTPTWISGAPFPYTFTDGSCDDCWVGGVSYTDDGAAPAIGTVTPSPGSLVGNTLSLPFGTTSVTLAAALTDAAGVLTANADGSPMTLDSGDENSGTWSATLAVDATTTSIAIEVLDRCGRTTTRTLQVSFQSANPASPRIGGWSAGRGGPRSSLIANDPTNPANTNRMIGHLYDRIRAALPNATFSGTEVITPDYLDTIDILWIGSWHSEAQNGVSPLSSAEQAAIHAFATAGGTVMIFAETPQPAFGNPYNLSTAHGFVQTFGLQLISLSPSRPRAWNGDALQPATVDSASNWSATNGPFGLIDTYYTRFPGVFWSVPAPAQIIARLAPGAVVTTTPSNDRGVLAFIPCNGLAPGSGAVLISSDSSMLQDDGNGVGTSLNETSGHIPMQNIILNMIAQHGTCGSPCDGVVCSASDQCHLAGTCDPATGTCSSPLAPDGTSCVVQAGCGSTWDCSCEAGECIATCASTLQLTCPPNVTIGDGQLLPAADFAGGSATGGCINPQVTLLSQVEQGACPTTITRTYQALNEDGVPITCEQSINDNRNRLAPQAILFHPPFSRIGPPTNDPDPSNLLGPGGVVIYNAVPKPMVKANIRRACGPLPNDEEITAEIRIRQTSCADPLTSLTPPIPDLAVSCTGNNACQACPAGYPPDVGCMSRTTGGGPYAATTYAYKFAQNFRVSGWNGPDDCYLLELRANDGLTNTNATGWVVVR